MSASRKYTISGQSATLEEFDDGRSYDPKAVKVITQEWVDDNMKNRESDFSEYVGATIFCGTWNVNAKKQDIELNDWILPDGVAPSDVYAIGFQEIVDLNAMNVALDNTKSQQRGQFWQELIATCLLRTGISYQMLSSRVMVGLYLCIFIKETLMNHVRDIRSSQLGVGIMGIMGNKGGVSIRMSLYDSSVCFVCAHLAAHRENVSGRNSDYKNIYEKTLFPADGMYDESNRFDDGDVVRPRHGAAKSYGVDLSVPDHDFVFWLGDLNYRIDDDISIDEIFMKIKNNELLYLRDKDQLNIERLKGNVFQGFYEGDLFFAPTYKYQPGTDEYEARPEKKKRAPAWCDRVLWRIATGLSVDSVSQLHYRRSNLMPSDHKPVSSSFACKFKSIISDTENQVYRQLMMELELFNNATTIPMISISDKVINFGKVKYEVLYEMTIVITNTGSTVAHWHMMAKLEETRVSKRWSSISPRRGLLLPERSTSVEIKLKIDRLTAQLINAGKESLEDIVVVRVERAKDIYIAITAEFERSCYGVSLDELICTTDPMRNTIFPARISPTISPADTSSQPASPSSNMMLKQAIPKELWRLIDALWTGGALREKDLFGQTPDKDELAAVREALDCGLEFPVCTPHALAEALVSFLEALAKPVVPLDLLPTSPIDQQNYSSWSRRFLESLPPLSYNVMIYTLSFMREVLAQAEYNRSTPGRLANVCLRCFAPTYDALPNHNIILSKDERIKRDQRLGMLLDVMSFLLTTSTI